MCAPYCGDASVCLGWGSCGVVVAIEVGIVDIQNQNNDTKLQCCSVSTSKVSIDDAISICAQMESLVGLVMVRVKDKAEWVQWAMSPMGKGRKREVGKEGADGGCSFLGATRNINKPLHVPC